MTSEAERALDTYLAAAARAGDRRLTALLIERWTPRLSSFAWRLLQRREAVEDVVQEAWLEILGSLPHLRMAEAFPAFAFRITQRKCIRLIEQDQRDRRLEGALVAEGDQESAFEPAVSVDGGRALRLIQQLPPGQQAVLWLYYMEDLSVNEIALSLDVPVGTVKTRMMHARQKLAALLEGEEQ